MRTADMRVIARLVTCLWMLFFAYVFCLEKQDSLMSNVQHLELNHDIPALFSRIYKEWSGEVTCINESLKSSEAEVKEKGQLRFRMKARIAAHSRKPVTKVELWLEFYNYPMEFEVANNIYTANIRPLDTRIEPTIQDSPTPIISSKMIEISFNVTDLYMSSKNLNKKYTTFRIHLHGSQKTTPPRELLESKHLKAFLIIYEFEDSCSDRPINANSRSRRSLELFRKKSSARTPRESIHSHFETKAKSTLGNFRNVRIHSEIPLMKNLHPRRHKFPHIHGNDARPSIEKLHRRVSNVHHVHGSNARSLLKSVHPGSKARTLVKDAHQENNGRSTCKLTEWYVEFDNIGWDQWVIAPKGVMAYTCSGECPFPLGSEINSTAHAHLQTFVYYFRGEKWPACCVPHIFEPLTMVLYDRGDDMLFMISYPNMIAKSCACL